MRLGSLCTGIGGLDLAAGAHFGAEVVWHSEVEPAPCIVLKREWPGVPNLGDLTVVDWADVPPVDVLTAGYPCQPFSSAGRRQGADDVRHLWPFVAGAVRVLRPRVVVLENVAGHLVLGFDAVLGDLAEAGLDAEWCVLRASDVGAPHGRARLFVVATLADTEGQRRATRRRHRAVPGLEVNGRETVEPRRRRDASSPDADSGRLQERQEQHGQAPCAPTHGHSRWGHADGLGDLVWGRFEPAIRRWERVLERQAPRPVEDNGSLRPQFVEWMMGYPAGWVDGLSRTQALKALGNAVVPQQGLAALRELAPVMEAAA